MTKKIITLLFIVGIFNATSVMAQDSPPIVGMWENIEIDKTFTLTHTNDTEYQMEYSGVTHTLKLDGKELTGSGFLSPTLTFNDTWDTVTVKLAGVTKEYRKVKKPKK